MLKPCAVKVASTVLRRGLHREMGFLSDEVLRLKYRNQLSNRQIQTMTGVSRNSVANYIKSYIIAPEKPKNILKNRHI
jgi:transcriptional regulator of aromatic amino acid metabolism